MPAPVPRLSARRSPARPRTSWLLSALRRCRALAGGGALCAGCGRVKRGTRGRKRVIGFIALPCDQPHGAFDRDLHQALPAVSPCVAIETRALLRQKLPK